jgi:DNA-binding response OmpR family regulator
VVVDVAWPSYNGLELCEQIRTRNDGIRILLVAPRAAALDPGRLSAANVTLVPKPFSSDVLLEIVKDILENGET